MTSLWSTRSSWVRIDTKCRPSLAGEILTAKWQLQSCLRHVANTHTHMLTATCTDTHMHTHKHPRTHAHPHTCTHTHTHARTHTHTHTPTHTHTKMWTCERSLFEIHVRKSVSNCHVGPACFDTNTQKWLEMHKLNLLHCTNTKGGGF